jgi:HAE1 family hydrophobic/amphiphilic exporter-1
MLYIVSQATGDGSLQINVVFTPGTNVDQAQVLVQNRVAIALPRLPQEVQRIGVTVKKKSPDLMLVVHLISPDGTLDQQYISNYATINIKDVLTRVDGVGDTVIVGARDYSMRVWLDPAMVSRVGLPQRRGNGAAGPMSSRSRAINQPPATSPGGFQVAVQTLGRLTSGSIQRHHRRYRSGWPGDAGARASRVGSVGRHTTNAYLDGSRHRPFDISAARLERSRDRPCCRR